MNRICCGVVLLLGAGGASAQEAPKYDGWTLESCLKEVSAKGPFRALAVRTLGKIGLVSKEVVPALLAAARDEDEYVRLKAVDALGEVGPAAKEAVPVLIEAARSRNAFNSHKALVALRKLRKEALPALVAAAREDSAIRHGALWVLGDMGADAVPALLELFKDKDVRLQRYVAEELERMGSEARSAIPELVKALEEDERGYLAQTVIIKLGQGGLEELQAALAHKNPLVRLRAADIMWKRPTPAGQVASPLRKLLKDPDHAVRVSAAFALVRIDPATQEAITALKAGLAEPNRYTRWVAAAGLLLVGVEVNAARGEFEKALRENDYVVRTMAVKILGDVRPGGKAVTPLLALAIKDADSWVRLHAAAALLPSQPGNVEAAAVLVAGLGDEDIPTSTLSDLLDRVGPAAVPTLTRALASPSLRARDLAAVHLGRLGPAAKEAVPALVKALEDTDSFISRRARAALGAIGPVAAREAVPALARLLKKFGAKDEAVQALGRLGPDAVPALLEATKDNKSPETVEALGAIGPGAKAAVPALVTLLTDPDTFLRRAAAGALANIGPDAHEASSALVTALKDGDPVVRQRAAAALKRVDPVAAIKAGIK
jgi:HEAT repeat protein